MQLNSPDWTAPPSEPEFPAPPLQVWRLRLGDLDGDPEEMLRSLTVPPEHARARRYEFDADRHRHLAGRALVRLVLARQYDCGPRDLSLAEGPHGKPHLQSAPNEASPLHFNVAHTADVVVAAVSQKHPVGIDVEARNRDADLEGLAHRVLTETEQRHWQNLPEPDRRGAFLHLWTCKEAFLKATGRGLQRALTTIECTFDGDTVAALTDADGPPSSSGPPAAQWAVRPFSVSAGTIGAIVCKHEIPASLAWIDAASECRGRDGP